MGISKFNDIHRSESMDAIILKQSSEKSNEDFE